MLTSIHLQNFKGFKDTKIEPLRKVNLVVGGQNVGKTSLLEGVWLGCSQLTNTEEEIAGILMQSGLRGTSNFIRTKHWYKQDRKQKSILISVNANSAGFERPLPMKCFSTYPISDDMLQKASNAAIRDERKPELIDLLQAIEPRLSNLENLSPEDEPSTVCLHASIGLGKMMPISEIGQGVGRLAYLYSTLLASNTTLALIDEIENGIHYSSLPTVFEGIKNIAQSNDVQSIITTHSWEAVRAAYKVFKQTPKDFDSFQIIRLERIEDNVRAVLINGEDLDTVMEANYEIR